MYIYKYALLHADDFPVYNTIILTTPFLYEESYTVMPSPYGQVGMIPVCVDHVKLQTVSHAPLFTLYTFICVNFSVNDILNYPFHSIQNNMLTC